MEEVAVIERRGGVSLSRKAKPLYEALALLDVGEDCGEDVPPVDDNATQAQRQRETVFPPR